MTYNGFSASMPDEDIYDYGGRHEDNAEEVISLVTI
jgi:hypothetical protein